MKLKDKILQWLNPRVLGDNFTWPLTFRVCEKSRFIWDFQTEPCVCSATGLWSWHRQMSGCTSPPFVKWLRLHLKCSHTNSLRSQSCFQNTTRKENKHMLIEKFSFFSQICVHPQRWCQLTDRVLLCLCVLCFTGGTQGLDHTSLPSLSYLNFFIWTSSFRPVLQTLFPNTNPFSFKVTNSGCSLLLMGLIFSLSLSLSAPLASLTFLLMPVRYTAHSPTLRIYM